MVCGACNKRVEPVVGDGDGGEWACDAYSGKGFAHSRQQGHPDAKALEDICGGRAQAGKLRRRFARSKTVLGEGGFAKVWLGHDKEADAPVAIKATLRRNANDRFEAELLSCLGAHGNVVKLLACYPTSKKRLCMVYELLPGDVLQILSRVDRLEDGAASAVTRDVTRAVEFMHGRNIAHRDLKPENVLYTGSLEGGTLSCKLADFGTATYFKDKTEIFSERLGTSCYVAPEVLKQKYYPARADIWSLGATVFMLLAGEAPFHGPFQDLTLHRVLTTKLVLPACITRHASTAAQHFILSTMTRHVWRRPDAATLLKHPWLLQVGANGAGTTVAGGEATGNGTASGPGEAVEAARDRKAAEAGGPAALEARTRLGPIIALPPAEDPALLDDETLLALPTL